jgi:nicotinamide-nucleotide amidase
MNAEIIAIGDEITSGQNLDTNSQWLSQRLEELGVRVLYHSTVGDELTPGVEVFRHAIARADVIVASGGLGPTADDLTREALAEATGRPLQLDSDALACIRLMFASRNRPMPVSNERQAMFPAGSRVVRNPHGTAPGIDLEVAREGTVPIFAPAKMGLSPLTKPTPCRVICLPGVPAEMVEMWHDSVGAAIAGFIGAGRRVIHRRLIHCFGAGESQIEAMLPDLIRRGRRPTVGITASKATITLRITADGATEEECLAAIAPVEATIRQCLGTLVFGAGDDELQHVVVRLLRERGKTLATAECGTAGLLAAWLSGVDDAASVFRGGLVLAESTESADAMATRCREQFNADYGLSISVLPSPASGKEAGDEGSEPLAVSVALASADGIKSKSLPWIVHPALSHVFRAKQALNFLRLAVS